MRLALDATLFDAPTTGIALATKQLAQALERQGHDVERWGATSSGEVPRGERSRTSWTLGVLPQLLRERRPALFHATSNFNLPLARVEGVPFVLTVHDVVPLLLPETVSLGFRWQFQAWLTRSLEVAAEVICVSETTRVAVLEHFEVDPKKLTVAHHGVDHVMRVKRADRISSMWLDAQGLPEQFVLYAGALDARKNVELVLRAMEQLHHGGQPATLVLAGQRWFGGGRIERKVRALQERGLDVRPLGYLEDSVFYELMRRATVFVFPSRYEGFGLPPLEAMRLGVPTIISNAGSLPEVCGDGAMQVGVDDFAALARHINTVLSNSVERERWSSKGMEHASTFTWASSAAAISAVYARLTGSRT